jgi:hypothetical protein
MQLHHHLQALTARLRPAYAARMKPMRCASLVLYCAIASSGCGSSAGTPKGILGSYAVMVSSGAKVDSDVMTVTQGAGDSLLLTFEFGITTDAGTPNADGLRAALSGTKLTVGLQPAHVDQSSGKIDGNISGSGTLKSTGDCELMFNFTPTSGSALALQVSGSKL